jgi:hypothetical protein
MTTITLTARVPKRIKREVERVAGGNVSAFVREALEAKLSAHQSGLKWIPKTPFGRDLWRLRQLYIRRGGALSSSSDIDAELRGIRGERE